MFQRNLTKDILGASSTDDDFGPHRRDTHFDAGVAILSELPGQNFVQLGKENSICYELSIAEEWGIRLSIVSIPE